MNSLQTNLIFSATLLLALAVGLGAFGAHALEGRISPDDAAIYETANKYHFIHALGLLMLSQLIKKMHRKPIKWAGIFLFSGILLFSGSLYALALSEAVLGERLNILGAITPIGGLAFIIGWLIMAFSLWRKLGVDRYKSKEKSDHE